MIDTTRIKPGFTRALYRGDRGKAPAVRCTITGLLERTDGREALECRVDGTCGLQWGYLDQFTLLPPAEPNHAYLKQEPQERPAGV